MADIHHNEADHQFETRLQGHVAELTYTLDGDCMTFTHTGVPGEFRGKGVGAALVKAGLDYARAKGLRVIPQCSFVAAYIRRNPEYQSLVEEQ